MYLIVDYRYDPIFPMLQGTLPWKPCNFRVKWAKSANSFSFVALAFRNGLKYRNSYFTTFNVGDLATSCKYLAVDKAMTFVTAFTARVTKFLWISQIRAGYTLQSRYL